MIGKEYHQWVSGTADIAHLHKVMRILQLQSSVHPDDLGVVHIPKSLLVDEQSLYVFGVEVLEAAKGKAFTGMEMMNHTNL